jgi:DNA-binding IclR family transcriptional regulator
VPLVPPFGAVFIAWDGERAAERWLDRAVTRLSARERRRYRSALAAARLRGYSITIANAAAPDLARLLDALVDDPRAEQGLRHRDELIRELVHTEFLPSDVEPDRPLRVSQMSAPVFDSSGRVAAAIMVLGPDYDLDTTAVTALGEPLLAAARDATARLGGRPPQAARRGAA